MPPVFHYAYCNPRFPSEEPEARPVPRSYPTTSRGVPLWFVDDLSSFANEGHEEEDAPRDQDAAGAEPVASGPVEQRAADSP
jgi:hypothetical protein